MALTVDEIVQNVLNQLYISDPTVSAEVGTPERKIIEAVAEMIAQSQVDFNILDVQHDISTMTGGRLDAYLTNFGMGRQLPTAATGIVTFGRNSPVTTDLFIPQGTQVVAHLDTQPDLVFVTITSGTISLGGSTNSVDIAAQCSTPGSIGNVAANTITGFSGLQSVAGITSVTNASAMSGGTDGETDEQYRARFQNTIFRNQAGTYDQFLALAISQTGVTKANVVGPISRFQEYMLIPASAGANQDSIIVTYSPTAQTYSSTTTGSYDPNGTTWPEKRTTQPSTNPYSKYTYDQQYYLTDGNLGTSSTFFKPFKDYIFNRFPVLQGDTPTWTTAGSDGNGDFVVGNYVRPSAPNGHYYCVTVGGTVTTTQPSWPTSPGATVTKDGITYKEQGTVTPGAGRQLLGTYNATLNQPNVTILNARASDNVNGNLNLKSGSVVLLEHAYISKSSRNDYYNSVFNCIDVFVNGTNPTQVSSIEVVPGTENNLQQGNAGSWTYYQNNDGSPSYRRTINGQAAGTNILPGSFVANRLLPLYWQPVVGVPDYLHIGTSYYFKARYVVPRWQSDTTYTVGDLVRPTAGNGHIYAVTNTIAGSGPTNQGESGDTEPAVWSTSGGTTADNELTWTDQGVLDYGYYNAAFTQRAHYWQVNERTGYYGTFACRNGLEFVSGLAGATSQTQVTGSYSDPTFATRVGGQFTIKYSYDQNIPALQAIMDKNKQITTDVLVHRALTRYFTPYVSIMYSLGSTISVVNVSINAALANFFESQYYGSAIQMSDILQTIHNVPGVDNVRWTSDDGTLIGGLQNVKVQEVNPDGTTLDSKPPSAYKTNDFFIQDNQLAASPAANICVIKLRSQNTWTSP